MNSIIVTIWAFYVLQSLFFSDRLRFWSLGDQGGKELGWRGHTCVKNLPRVGAEIRTKFGGDWSGCSPVK